jgi:hypothetical protein
MVRGAACRVQTRRVGSRHRVNTVYTYHHADEAREWPAEIEVWADSWHRHGWYPVVLTERDARRSPLFPELFECVNSLPTVNGHAYENACYFRWLALHERGGGLLTDYDVVNRGYRPDHLLANAPAIHLHLDKVPCAFYATPAGLETTFQWWRKPGEPFIVLGQPHYSDMHLCARFSSFPVDPACSEFGDPRVNGLPLVHCASERTRVIGLDKVTVMKSIT